MHTQNRTRKSMILTPILSMFDLISEMHLGNSVCTPFIAAVVVAVIERNELFFSSSMHGLVPGCLFSIEIILLFSLPIDFL